MESFHKLCYGAGRAGCEGQMIVERERVLR